MQANCAKQFWLECAGLPYSGIYVYWLEYVGLRYDGIYVNIDDTKASMCAQHGK